MTFQDACGIVMPRTRSVCDTRDREGYGVFATFDPGVPQFTIPPDPIPSLTIKDAYHAVELIGWSDIEALHAGLGRVLAGRGK